MFKVATPACTQKDGNRKHNDIAESFHPTEMELCLFALI